MVPKFLKEYIQIFKLIVFDFLQKNKIFFQNYFFTNIKLCIRHLPTTE